MNASGETGTTVPGAPVAVVGMSCRLPQADDPAAFWRLLRDGRDAVTEVPAGRWPGSGRTTWRGGFLADIEGFDPAFFGISPLEAAALDPQQRLALELAWEALEQSGRPPADLAGTATGVFLGAVASEYATLADRRGPELAGAHTYTGGHRSLIANRVSYALGLRGPSLTVDCGQSSSLVAVHLAIASLRRGEATVALAGGVDLHLLAETTQQLEHFGALSPTGACHTFDDRADGYVRGEGGALIVLKTLAAAEADGDRVHAVLLGSAVNNDGGGRSLTSPRSGAQREVITLACADAGVDPVDLEYVELHGTGTPIGDPVEAAALGAVAGRGRDPERPLLVGSVKTNVGHLEGAAGITGLLKVVLAARHGELPPSLNFVRANPAVDLAGRGLQVLTTARPWPAPGLAGVSSFGMGGTNCHVVLATAPAGSAVDRSAPPAGSDAADRPLPLLVSARSAGALAGQARRLLPVLADTDPTAVRAALLHTRTAFEHRAVLLDGPQPDRDVLTALAAGRPAPQAITGTATGGPVVFTFPGQGAQWPGMAGALAAAEPVFADQLRGCADALAPFVDHDPMAVLIDGADGDADLTRVDVVQPALWAMLVSLAALWASYGVRPDVVIGHSQGEIAAATVAGALSLDDAARVVARRSHALRSIAPGGGMLSVAAPREVVEAALRGRPELTLAAVNGPQAVLLSGPRSALAELAAGLEEAGHWARAVPVDYASHSPAVEPLRERVLAELAGLTPRATGLRFLSTRTGGELDTRALTADYWYDSLRHQVRFADAVGLALRLAPALVIECSPHPVAVAAVEQNAEAAGSPVSVIGTLRRDDGGSDRFRRALAQAYVAGAPVRWTDRATPAPRDLPELPTYAFARGRHWLTGTGSAGTTPMRSPWPAATPPVEASTTPAAAAAPVSGRGRGELRELVRGLTAEALGHPDPAAVDPGRSFKELGVDSAAAVDLRNRLRAATGLVLPSGLLFDQPTVHRLGDHLERLLGATGGNRAGGDRALATAPVEVACDAATGAEPVAAGVPIAIVALGCRLPGGIDGPEALWRLLAAGEEGRTEFPADRGWDLDRLAATGPHRSGTSDTRHGGFLSSVADFDAEFFGISPREALAMDPQQRLLLEVCWETLERAGLDPSGLAGSATGVFVGAMAPDYGPRLHLPTGATEGHLLTGTALSVVSGRLAYHLGLHGPALTVDTACSSSLVALHLAVRALRQGECSAALVAGATVMATPGMFVEFSRQGGLAPDGRCKAFGAAADGTAWAEGVVAALLLPAPEARRRGLPVLAEIRGTAVNQDGRSNGLTAPNGPAQERVIRQALTDAGLGPAEVDVLEAHGTGTRLGDPLEAEALLATYGAAHDAEHPVWLGSLKSNLGHTQAAAGLAGVLKSVLALRHREVPRTLHAEPATGHVDWSGGALRLAVEPVALPTEGPVRAAVSSFGISGTNAHVVLEVGEPAATPPGDAPADGDPTADRPLVYVLTARSAAARRRLAAALGEWVRTAPDAALPAAARALAARTVFAHRAVVVAADRAELAAGLAALAADRPHPAVQTGTADPDVRTVLVFPGQGGQWAGMAADLLGEPSFAAVIDECGAALAPMTGWTVRDVLTAAPGAPALTGSDVIQPVLFAVMTGLAALWRSAGLEPAAVVGHSQGELAAACAAGALRVGDTVGIVWRRARALLALTGTGGLLAVNAGRTAATELLSAYPDRAWLAIVNGPASTVLGGDPEVLEELAAAAAAAGLRARPVAIDYAAHTPHIETIRDDLLAALAGAPSTPSTLQICCGATGGAVEPERLTPEFWYAGLRGEVQFDRAVLAAAGPGHTVFVEASPHPVLTGHVEDTLRAAGRPATAVGTLRRGDGGPRRWQTAAAAAFVAGAPISWPALLGPAGAPPADLPTYPFERQRFWLDPATDAVGTDLGHPAVTAVVPLAGDAGVLVTARMATATLPWLPDHAVAGTVLLPGTALLELAMLAAHAAGGTELAELTVLAPVLLPDGPEGVELQLAVGAADETGRRPLSLHGRTGAGDWTLHALGAVTTATSRSGPDADTAAPGPADPLDPTSAYDELAAAGYAYGPAFRGLRALTRTTDGAVADVALPDAETGRASAHLLHPALLDAALHPLVLDRPGEPARLPFSWRGVRITARGSSALRVRITGGGDRAGLVAYDPAGAVVAEIDGIVLRAAPGVTPTRPPLYRVEPVPLPDPEPAAGRWSVLDLDGGAGAWAEALATAGLGGEAGYDLAGLAELGAVPDVVLVPRPDLGADPDAGYETRQAVLGVLDLIQGWLGDPRYAAAKLVLATTGGGGPAGAALRGLVRAAEAEHPHRFGLLDVGPDPADPAGAPSGPDSVSWPAVAGALAAGEWELTAGPAGLTAPRLRPVPAADPKAADPTDANAAATTGTVLVTGGTGGLGALLALRLAERHGVRDLLLVSRRGAAAPEAAALDAALRELGVDVEIVSCDVADPAQVRCLLRDRPADRPVSAVVHAAGVVADGLVTALGAADVDRVLGPKVEGAWALHEAFADRPLDRFVLVGSVAGRIGTAGQANYAAANAFLGGLAEHRRATGRPATTISFGLWELATGVSAGLGPAGRDRLARSGHGALSTADGLELFDAAWTGTETEPVAARWDRAGLLARSAAGTLPPVLTELVPTTPAPARAGTAVLPTAAAGPSAGPAPVAADGRGLVDRLAGLGAAAGRRLLGDLVRGHVAAVLSYADADRVDAARPFTDLGFDSLTAVELRNRLDRDTGLTLGATVAFDHPSVDALAGHLHTVLVPASPTPADRVRDLLRELRAEVDPADTGTRRELSGLLRRALDRWTDTVEDSAGDDPDDDPRPPQDRDPDRAGPPDDDDAADDVPPRAYGDDEALFALIDQGR